MQVAAIAASGNGANAIVAGAAGRKVRVFAWHLSFSGAVNAKWQDGGTDVTGLTYGGTNVNTTAPPVSRGHGGGLVPYFEGGSGNALNLNLSTNVAVGGWVLYEQVTE